MPWEEFVDSTKLVAKCFAVCIIFIFIPLSIIMGIAGVITTAILHTTVPRPGKSVYLILIEATCSLTILVNAFFLYTLVAWPPTVYYDVVIYIGVGIIVCALGIIALSREGDLSRNHQRGLSDAVQGLLWTTVGLQAICLSGTVIYGLDTYGVIDLS